MFESVLCGVNTTGCLTLFFRPFKALAGSDFVGCKFFLSGVSQRPFRREERVSRLSTLDLKPKSIECFFYGTLVPSFLLLNVPFCADHLLTKGGKHWETSYNFCRLGYFTVLTSASC